MRGTDCCHFNTLIISCPQTACPRSAPQVAISGTSVPTKADMPTYKHVPGSRGKTSTSTPSTPLLIACRTSKILTLKRPTTTGGERRDCRPCSIKAFGSLPPLLGAALAQETDSKQRSYECHPIRPRTVTHEIRDFNECYTTAVWANGWERVRHTAGVVHFPVLHTTQCERFPLARHLSRNFVCMPT